MWSFYKSWPFSGEVQVSQLKRAEKLHREKFDHPGYDRYRKAIELTKPIAQKIRRKKIDFLKFTSAKNQIVKIGTESDLNLKEHKIIEKALKNMVPWRKGPFELFGHKVDAEWRSDLKWQRVKKHTGPLQGKSILDIGCNNGYYMYLMAHQKPRFLLGIDPVVPYYYQYQFLKQFAPVPNCDFRFVGIQDMVHFKKTFDIVFCMGILYHHPDPVSLLKTVYQCMRPGGLIIIEGLGINREGPYFLMPKTKYLGTSGNWFIPSKEGLENLVRRSGFQYVETFFKTKLSSEEQRSTDHSPYDSFIEGLNPDNHEETIEGYPAPWRFYLKARKARIRR